MKRTALWLAALACAGIAMAMAQAVFVKDRSAVLALDFDRYAIPHATFVIDGRPVHAMVDTGSSFGLHLHESLLQDMRGLRRQRSYASTDLSGKIQENVEYTADSLDVNGIALKNISVTPFKSWGMTVSGDGPLPESNVVGLGAFKDVLLELDYAARSMTMTRLTGESPPVPKNYREIPFRLTPDGMVFEVGQAGRTYRMVLDTGATVSVVWSERLGPHVQASCLEVDPEMDNAGCEATVLALAARDGQAERFGAVVVSGNFRHMGRVDGLIGNNFLREYKLRIDLKAGKAWISPQHHFTEPAGCTPGRLSLWALLLVLSLFLLLYRR